VGALEFRLTHDILAIMLGVRRPSVTLTVQHLDRLGLVDYRRGRFSIRDREGLEVQSCECYHVVQEHVTRLFSRVQAEPSGGRQA
jgi:Mn-dependent DtxR family transcriptional regulator